MTPEIIIFFILIFAITLYALLGGADFGVGIWEVNTVFLAPKEEREFIYKAIGPVWEANHVWLIFAIVILQTAFPVVFSALSRALWIPLLFALVGIIFRGAAYAFRSYSIGEKRHQEFWGVIFALASTTAPMFLGASLGAIASGTLKVEKDGEFLGNPIFDWISPLSIIGAIFGVGVCTYLAAVYLTREAQQMKNSTLEELWRKRALATGFWMGFLSLVGIGMIASHSSFLWEGFYQKAITLVFGSFISGILSLVFLWKKRATVAVILSGLAVATVLWGLSYSLFPYLIPPYLTLYETKAPDVVLWTMIGMISFGSVVLFPSLIYLFYLFKKKIPEERLGKCF